MSKPKFTINFLKTDNLAIQHYPAIQTCSDTKVYIPPCLYDLDSQGTWVLDHVVDQTSQTFYGDDNLNNINPTDGMVYNAYYWLSNPCSDVVGKGCVMVKAYDLKTLKHMQKINCCTYFQEHPLPKVPRDSTKSGYVQITFYPDLSVQGKPLRNQIPLPLKLQKVDFEEGKATIIGRPKDYKYQVNQGITCSFIAWYK